MVKIIHMEDQKYLIKMNGVQYVMNILVIKKLKLFAKNLDFLKEKLIIIIHIIIMIKRFKMLNFNVMVMKRDQDNVLLLKCKISVQKIIMFI